MDDVIVGLFVGAGIGLTLGLMGAGGSILTVPALLFIADLSSQEAAGTSLIVVGGAALMGATIHYRAGRSSLNTGITLGATGIGGAVLGSWLHSLASEEMVLLVLAVLITASASVIVLRIPRAGEGVLDIPHRWPKMVASGTALGILTGFFGIGGGFLIIPVLVLILGLPMRLAVGTSLIVITINATAGLIGHVGFGEVRLGEGAPLLGGAVIGTFFGTRLVGRFNEKVLRGGFAALLYSVAGLIAYRGFSDLL